MSVPSHQPSCATKTWPTTCDYCGGAVFYFSCNCGSRVFFDALGEPWPQHFDSCLGHKIRVLRDAEGLSLDAVQQLVEADAERRGIAVPPKARSLFRTLGFRETGAATILTLTPGVEPREFVAVLRDMNAHVNFFKRLKFEDNRVGRALLGELAEEPYVEVFLRGDTNRRTGYCAQVEAFIPRTMLERARVARGGRVVARIVPCCPKGDVRIWIVEELKRRE
jgi:hypothetical protein